MTKIDVCFENETVWLTQQMAELFQSSRSNIVEHIQHIYAEGELNGASTCRKFRQVCTAGKLEENQVIQNSEQLPPTVDRVLFDLLVIIIVRL